MLYSANNVLYYMLYTIPYILYHIQHSQYYNHHHQQYPTIQYQYINNNNTMQQYSNIVYHTCYTNITLIYTTIYNIIPGDYYITFTIIIYD